VLLLLLVVVVVDGRRSRSIVADSERCDECDDDAVFDVRLLRRLLRSSSPVGRLRLSIVITIGFVGNAGVRTGVELADCTALVIVGGGAVITDVVGVDEVDVGILGDGVRLLFDVKFIGCDNDSDPADDDDKGGVSVDIEVVGGVRSDGDGDRAVPVARAAEYAACSAATASPFGLDGADAGRWRRRSASSLTFSYNNMTAEDGRVSEKGFI
jgi:hypothetical protein